MNDHWKRKLAAYLHDPPSKALDIWTHTERSATAFRQAGFTEEEVNHYLTSADHTAAAADRLPFPRSQAAVLQCVFDGKRNAFIHPLGGAEDEAAPRLEFHAELASPEVGMEVEQTVQPSISNLDSLPELERWRAQFFSHWRLWPKSAAERDHRLGLLPADTRIPDHTIWNHMQIVSALAGCHRASSQHTRSVERQLSNLLADGHRYEGAIG
jgi:CRISPR-associated protein Cmr2